MSGTFTTRARALRWKLAYGSGAAPAVAKFGPGPDFGVAPVLGFFPQIAAFFRAAARCFSHRSAATAEAGQRQSAMWRKRALRYPDPRRGASGSAGRRRLTRAVALCPLHYSSYLHYRSGHSAKRPPLAATYIPKDQIDLIPKRIYNEYDFLQSWMPKLLDFRRC